MVPHYPQQVLDSEHISLSHHNSASNGASPETLKPTNMREGKDG